VAPRLPFASIEAALQAWGGLALRRDRFTRAAAAVEAVIAIDKSTRPTFYLTAGRNYVGVLDDEGVRLVRIQGRKVRARHRAAGFTARTAVAGKSLPDDNLPFGLDL
jgi:hypothetical protein